MTIADTRRRRLAYWNGVFSDKQLQRFLSKLEERFMKGIPSEEEVWFNGDQLYQMSVRGKRLSTNFIYTLARRKAKVRSMICEIVYNFPIIELNPRKFYIPGVVGEILSPADFVLRDNLRNSFTRPPIGDVTVNEQGGWLDDSGALQVRTEFLFNRARGRAIRPGIIPPDWNDEGEINNRLVDMIRQRGRTGEVEEDAEVVGFERPEQPPTQEEDATFTRAIWDATEAHRDPAETDPNDTRVFNPTTDHTAIEFAVDDDGNITF